MENKINTVTIPLERYDELRECEVAYEKMQISIAVLLKNAELSWDKKELNFEAEDMRSLAKTFDINFYLETVEDLNKKENKINE